MAKRKFKRSIAIITVVCVAGLIFASCGKEDVSQTESVIVLGTHMNADPIDINNNKLIDQTLDKLCRTGGKLSVIISDGSPYLSSSYEIKPPEKGVSEKVVERHVTNNKSSLKQAIIKSNPYAKTEETDPIEALKLAGRILESSEKGRDKELLFVHTGIATAGMLKDNLTANAKDIVQYLKDQKVNLSFDGVNAVLTHLGEVAGKQDELSDSQLGNVEEIYKTILEDNGAKVNINRSVEVSPEEEDIQLPHVSAVKFPKPQVADLTKNEKAVLNENELTFYANKAELIDEASALSLISPYADQIKNNNLNVVVLGLTAKVGSRESSIDLSKKRAEAVARLLEKEGVDNSLITSIGGGFDTSFHIKDTDDDGKLILSEATKNRRVILLNGDTEEAKEIVAKHG